MSTPNTSVYTIPAGIPFAKTLAAELLKRTHKHPERLPDIRVFLPTRRARRVLQDAFVSLTGGRPLMLPRFHTLGDIDEEVLLASVAGYPDSLKFLDIPPAISPLRRRILLARLILAVPDFNQGFDHALKLAGALGEFMDHIYTENLDFADLRTLVPENLAEHWQITLNFLEILSVRWPEVLAEEGLIDPADRRNRFILALDRLWESGPPDFTVIAAGSTGSIPAVGRLLSTIAQLPKGEVVLPGLDVDLDPESWDKLDETHPQYGLKQLLGHMGVDRSVVKILGVENPHPVTAARQKLSSQVMRPPGTSHMWSELGTAQDPHCLKDGLKALSLFVCKTAWEEARTVSLLIRERLETPAQTVVLITPDRSLAHRVRIACKRWGIQVDDSAGTPLNQTLIGAFLLLILDACKNRFSASNVLALLKHPLCTVFGDIEDKTRVISVLEQYGFRAAQTKNNLNSVYEALEKKGEKASESIDFLRHVEVVLKQLSDAIENSDQGVKALIQAHIQAAESLFCSSQQHEGSALWSEESGELASVLFLDLLEHADVFPPVSLSNYADIFQTLSSSVTVRSRYGMHPRVSILGQLEARLVDADFVIMSGLNEGVWPADIRHDPWMSRPMRHAFGLPAHERGTGLSAHDFVQAFCTGDVAMTRSEYSGGSPTVPSRWLQRLETVLNAAGLSFDDLKAVPHLQWSRALDHSPSVQPCSRPSPCPPVPVRPRKLPVTAIDTWLRDPYSLYAKYILKLRPLDSLDSQTDSAIRGIVLHRILEKFIRSYPDCVPENAAQILKNISLEVFDELGLDKTDWIFWNPRLERIYSWFLAHEEKWRQAYTYSHAECNGQVEILNAGLPFTLTARADRIDESGDGYAVIDYKSAGQYSQSSILSGETPQLSLEGLIAAKKGFSFPLSKQVSYLGYWVLKGDASAGQTVDVTKGLKDLFERTEDALVRLINVFDSDHVPYHSLPYTDRISPYNDYSHLSRVSEWRNTFDIQEDTSSSSGGVE